ncbi:hypothetical protein DFH07DRAFT_777778 [Mycena maculata]|uniref:Uncharacterized protein n=1 Tax=Mycena maculata TaxID=230809 RepID=A0AAD7IIJ8_9AGAR|nr:hypothetical protein DFH07DRAFT_777778 [Mycena maculata]
MEFKDTATSSPLQHVKGWLAKKSTKKAVQPAPADASEFVVDTGVDTLILAASMVEKLANVVNRVPLIAPVAALVSEVLKTAKERSSGSAWNPNTLHTELQDKMRVFSGATSQESSYVHRTGRLKHDLEVYRRLLEDASKLVSDFDAHGSLRTTLQYPLWRKNFDDLEKRLQSFESQFILNRLTNIEIAQAEQALYDKLHKWLQSPPDILFETPYLATPFSWPFGVYSRLAPGHRNTPILYLVSMQLKLANSTDTYPDLLSTPSIHKHPAQLSDFVFAAIAKSHCYPNCLETGCNMVPPINDPFNVDGGGHSYGSLLKQVPARCTYQGETNELDSLTVAPPVYDINDCPPGPTQMPALNLFPGVRPMASMTPIPHLTPYFDYEDALRPDTMDRTSKAIAGDYPMYAADSDDTVPASDPYPPDI